MAFVKKTWKDRIVQYANRRLLTKSGGEVEQVTVTRDEGAISEAGDRFDAATMNDLEQRVKDGFDGLNASDIEYSSGVNVKDKIDTKQDNLTYESDDYNVSTYGGVVRCKKWGRVVNIQGYGLGTVTNMSTVQAYTMATIASKYRPITQQHIIGSMNAGSYATGSAQGYRINTDGTVVTYVYNGTKIENGYFNVTFII